MTGGFLLLTSNPLLPTPRKSRAKCLSTAQSFQLSPSACAIHGPSADTMYRRDRSVGDVENQDAARALDLRPSPLGDWAPCMKFRLCTRWIEGWAVKSRSIWPSSRDLFHRRIAATSASCGNVVLQLSASAAWLAYEIRSVERVGPNRKYASTAQTREAT